MKKAAVLLLLILLLLLAVEKGPSPTSQTLPVLPQFTVAAVAELELAQSGEVMLQARKREGNWFMVDGLLEQRLKNNVVEQLLSDLQDMHPDRVASRNPEHFTRFAVTDAGVRVRLNDAQGKILLQLIVGKPATDLRSTYVRLAGEDMVVTVDKILTWQVKRTAAAWLVEEKDSESFSPPQ